MNVLNICMFLLKHSVQDFISDSVSTVKKIKSLPLAFIAGIDTAQSLPSRSPAQLFTVPKCTVTKTAQASRDNRTDTKRKREHKLDFLFQTPLFTSTR